VVFLNIIGLIIAFSAAVFLIFKDYNMGLSLFTGAVILNFFSGFGFVNLFENIILTLQDPTTIQLMLVVTLISGLGYLMDLTGDMKRMIDACINIFKDGKILSMILPALIGTLSAPGGAILSAPMINESGDKIGLDKNRKTAINLFFRHIGYFIYPLYSSIIVASSMLNRSAASIIKYNAVIMLSGIIIAYFVFFRNLESEKKHKNRSSFTENIYNFGRAFFPIFIILFLALVMKVYFPLAALIGIVTAVFNKWPEEEKVKIFKNRFYKFFTKGIKYNLTLIIFGVMVFKTTLEKSGVINIIADVLTGLGLPLFLVIIVLGFISGYITGVHMAATGILLAIFIPLFPAGVEGPYVSLLLTSIIIGYLVSPLHLCLALTTEYFSSEIAEVYRLLFLPLTGMILAGVIQIMIFA